MGLHQLNSLNKSIMNRGDIFTLDEMRIVRSPGRDKELFSCNFLSLYHKIAIRSHKLAICYHKIASCYHKIISHSHKIASHFHKIQSCDGLLSCGNKIKNDRKTVLCPFPGSVGSWLTELVFFQGLTKYD